MFSLPPYPALAKGVISITGVGPGMEKALAARGVRTVAQLLLVLPRKYQDRRSILPISSLAPGQEALTGGRVVKVEERFSKKARRFLTHITIEEGGARITASWFRLPAHVYKTLKPGDRLVLFGPVTLYDRRPSMWHPELLKLKPGQPEPGPEIRPIYPDIADVKPGALRRVIRQAAQLLAQAPPIFPHDWLAAHGLDDPLESLKILHDPPASVSGPLPRPGQTRAWRNLARFELVFMHLKLMARRAELGQAPGWPMAQDEGLASRFISGLGFELTGAQKRVLKEIEADMAGGRAMHRLLMGDVASGKTVVAMAAVLRAVSAGAQAAFMAPLEALASQHHAVMAAHLDRLGVSHALFTAATRPEEKRALKQALAAGEVQVVFGTHALIGPDVEFARLGLAVIDEQHRFGVEQRLGLTNKAARAHTLVMSATPIPRTLASVIHGDLDISVLDGPPPTPRLVETRVYGPEEREQALARLDEHLAGGGQAFVVAPRIQAGEDEEACAQGLHERLARRYGRLAGLAHGGLPAAEKAAALSDFRAGTTRVLVATSVIEVGLDVAAAGLMLVDGAERFGLAQLHQLRGRVGRSGAAGLCLLVSGSPEPGALARLNLMQEATDGFQIAELDLKLRGPGEMAGLRQSGFPPLLFASLGQDMDLLEEARALAGDLMRQSHGLAEPRFRLVAETVAETSLEPEEEEAG